MIKQIIILRKDLKCRLGKKMAQAAHASMKVFFDRMDINYKNFMGTKISFFSGSFTNEMDEWIINGDFTKIVVGCKDIIELHELHHAAIDARIPCAMIEDNGRTEFNNKLTCTCLAIGPDVAEKVDKITGHLEVL